MYQQPSSPSNQTPSSITQDQDRLFNCSQRIVDFITECLNTKSYPIIPRCFPTSTQSINLTSPSSSTSQNQDFYRHSPPAPRSMQRRYDRNSCSPPPPLFHLPDTSSIHTPDDDLSPKDPVPLPSSSHPHIDPNHLSPTTYDTIQDHPIDEMITDPNSIDSSDLYVEPPHESFLLQNDVNAGTSDSDTNNGKLKSFTNGPKHSPLISLGKIFEKNAQPLLMMLDSSQSICQLTFQEDLLKLIITYLPVDLHMDANSNISTKKMLSKSNHYTTILKRELRGKFWPITILLTPGHFMMLNLTSGNPLILKPVMLMLSKNP